MAEVILIQGREKSVLRRHPWIFSGSIRQIKGNINAGETVKVLDNQGNFLAWGAYSPASQIRVRIWSWEETDRVDEGFIYASLSKCWNNRQALLSLFTDGGCNAYRLVHGESDGLPGLIVDHYSDILVIQSLSTGIEYWKESIIDCLSEITGISTIVERSDVDVRSLEKLPMNKGVLRGIFIDGVTRIQENGMTFWVDIMNGHKTGFYLDQKTNRQLIRAVSKEREVLDCFCYTGGFSISAAMGGAKSVSAIDSSEDALTLAEKNYFENSIASSEINFINSDVFTELRKLRDRAQSFDLIILDPPKFAKSASQVERAARGYKDINLLAMKLLRSGGLLATFSCSGNVSSELFQKILAGAALDAGVEMQIVNRMHQSFDHPVSLNFPEGAYLKGFVLQIN